MSRIAEHYTCNVSMREDGDYTADVAAFTTYLEQIHADVHAGKFTHADVENVNDASLGTHVITWSRQDGNSHIVDGLHPASAADPQFVAEQHRELTDDGPQHGTTSHSLPEDGSRAGTFVGGADTPAAPAAAGGTELDLPAVGDGNGQATPIGEPVVVNEVEDPTDPTADEVVEVHEPKPVAKKAAAKRAPAKKAAARK